MFKSHSGAHSGREGGASTKGPARGAHTEEGAAAGYASWSPGSKKGRPQTVGRAEALEGDQNQGRRSKACSRLEAEGPGLAGVAVTALGTHGGTGEPPQVLEQGSDPVNVWASPESARLPGSPARPRSSPNGHQVAGGAALGGSAAPGGPRASATPKPRSLHRGRAWRGRPSTCPIR